MSKTIAVINQKGGVGKTTTTFNLGANLAKENQRVLLIDLDSQGNLSSYIGWEIDELPRIEDLMGFVISLNSISNALENENLLSLTEIFKSAIRKNEKENIDYIPATKLLAGLDSAIDENHFRGKERILKVIVDAVSNDYDYILIDCPSPLATHTMNALTASDSIIIPVQTENFALEGLGDIFDTCKRVKVLHNPKLEINGILPTMTSHTKMSKQVLEILNEQFPALVYKANISRSTEASNSTAEQKSVRGKLGLQYNQVAKEFIERVV